MANCDVAIADQPADAAGWEILCSLRSKGFCVVDPGLPREMFAEACSNVEDLDAMGQLRRPPELLFECLLGSEGSARACEFGRPETGDTVTCLNKLDDKMTEVAGLVGEWLPELGFACPSRSIATVHETGMTEGDSVELTEGEATDWLMTLTRSRIMAVVVLGPIRGTLELKPFDEDAEAFEVPTEPGQIILLRSDVMTHKHFSQSRALLLSCYLLEEKPMSRNMVTAQNDRMVPAAKELEKWVVDRMKLLKEVEAEDESGLLVRDLPDRWVAAMNHLYHTSQRVAVRGMSGRYSSTWNVFAWGLMHPAGCDLVVKIPLQRWDCEAVFDPDPEAWRQRKTYLKHGSFMDGAELFDCKFFGLSPMESGGMDPHQREVLEVGYECLNDAGFKKGKIMNSLGGVYLGSSMTIFSNVSEVSGATGGAASINSNRFSFCLGMKGPSMTCDSEGSSSLAAVYLGGEAVLDKGRGQNNAYSLSGGVAFQLGALWWPQLQAARLLSALGRCLTWDATADGYAHADGVGFVALKRLVENVDGEQVYIESEPLRGVIASGQMNSNGLTASMHAPHGPTEMALVSESIKNAGLSPLNIDSVECNGQGAFIADAVEVDALCRVLRGEEIDEPLCVTCEKSRCGHGTEAAGIISLHRALLAGSAGTMTANLHLYQMNPHLEPENRVNYLSECVDYMMNLSYTGVTARGFGGTNVHIISHGKIDEQRIPQEVEVRRDVLFFWPGGGGDLEDNQHPTRGYYIAGTFSNWTPKVMQDEGGGSYGFTVTMGENKWEDFQIMLDGDRKKTLHPGTPKGPKGAEVSGPNPPVRGLNWRIDGTSQFVQQQLSLSNGEETTQSTEISTADKSEAGAKFRVRLIVAGKYRTVTWKKLAEVDPSGVTPGEYFVVSDWSGWAFEKMTKEDGSWHFEVKLLRAGGAFQIARNADWAQIICPTVAGASPQDHGYGPDDGASARGFNWCLDGQVGDVFKITFRQEATSVGTASVDSKKVSWEKLKSVALTPEETAMSKQALIGVVGSWNDWAQQHKLHCDSCDVGLLSQYSFYVQIGPDGQESFQLLQDCDWDTVIHPNQYVPFSSMPHVVRTTSPNDGSSLNLVWTISPHDGAAPGDIFQVTVSAAGCKVAKVRWQKAPAGPALEEAARQGRFVQRD